MDKIKTRKATVDLDIRFGERVTINAKLVRSCGVPLRIERERGVFELKEWKSRRITPVEVLVIGKRTPQNGETRFIDGGDGVAWHKKGSGVPAYLVVENMRTAPFYVPIEAIVSREAR